jgi:hypothetical protein
MADWSTKRIIQIKIGDRVASAVPGGDKNENHVVENVILTKDDRDFVDLKIASPVQGGVPQKTAHLTTTYHHPFYDITQAAFVDASELKVGDQLQQADGKPAVVESVRLYHATAITYNLTISGLHTYYVLAGDAPVLVHNSNCNSLTRAQADDVAEYLGYTKTNKRSAGGAAIWENNKAAAGQPRYITYDRTGHNREAVFKGANSRNPFQSTKDSARDGTYGLDMSPTGKVLGLKWLAK